MVFGDLDGSMNASHSSRKSETVMVTGDSRPLAASLTIFASARWASRRPPRTVVDT
jgi:hypothetical protein